jgi:nucleoside-diphosphate-sugar epimerase
MKAKKKNILLLGGFGFIGLNLLEKLFSAQNYSVLVFNSGAAPLAWATKAVYGLPQKGLQACNFAGGK